MSLLHELVRTAATQAPFSPAVRGPDGGLNYRELDSLCNQFEHALREKGVSRGDRVALWGEKSCRLIAAMQGVLRIGAVYVPIAASTPIARVEAILKNCSIRWIVTDQTRLGSLDSCEIQPAGILMDDLERSSTQPPDAIHLPDIESDDLAYILYTSGSTGEPKGVCISHQNAMSFVNWAVDALAIRQHCRFANHASFAFDLSVFDIYAAFATRSCVSVIPEATSFSASGLVRFIQSEQINVWYSVPSALMLMMESGKLLEQPNLQIETVIFAGEVFPISPLRAMRNAWPYVRLWNFYGPTETNVCAAYEVKDISPERATSLPIGGACSGDRLWLRAPSGCSTTRPEGELMVEGPTVMLGYWGREPQNGHPYATGDICQIDADGNLVFVARMDDMVKVRGYRIELQEVEAVLSTCPGIVDVAVVVHGEGINARLVCFFVSGHSPPSLIKLKEHCARRLPAYMLVNLAWRLDVLPRTPNGKVNRARLNEIANELAHTV